MSVPLTAIPSVGHRPHPPAADYALQVIILVDTKLSAAEGDSWQPLRTPEEIGRVFWARWVRLWDLPLGHRLRILREAAGLSQCKMAERLGINQSALCRLEQRHDALVSTAREYVEALGGLFELGLSLAPELNLSPELSQPYLPFGDFEPESKSQDFVFSVKPIYAEEILQGTKTVELRRRFRSRVSATSVALIYTTAPTMAITGVAQITGVSRCSVAGLWREYGSEACIERGAFDQYFVGVEEGFAIGLASARRLNRPLSLSELRSSLSFDPPQSYMLASPQLRDAVNAELG